MGVNLPDGATPEATIHAAGDILAVKGMQRHILNVHVHTQANADESKRKRVKRTGTFQELHSRSSLSVMYNISAKHLKAMDSVQGAKLAVHTADIHDKVTADTVEAVHFITDDLKAVKVKIMY